MAQQSRAKKKAIVGAVVGGVIAAATSKLAGMDTTEVWKRTIAGSVAGAIIGFAVGKRQDELFAGRDTAVREAHYDESQGYVARVEQVTFDPPQPKPGETVTLYVRYLVLGPNPNEPINVKMFRGLKYGNDYVYGIEPNEFVVPNGGGVVESTAVLTLPEKAPAGTYSVEALIENPQGLFDQAIGTGALYIFARAFEREMTSVAG
ncbi:MAG TPA: hypothetical protein VF608_06125 [Thermoanaerobaculia bacterium]